MKQIIKLSFLVAVIITTVIAQAQDTTKVKMDTSPFISKGTGNASDVISTPVKKDTGRIHDTIYVYLFNVTDTIACEYIYEGKKKRVYKEKGFVLANGFKIRTGNGFMWINQPNLIGVLDDKKRPVLTRVTII
jgi:hypothetical protein